MFRKLSRATLTDQVIEALIDYIQASDLKPGDALPAEGTLAEEYGVSRPVVREALKTLAGQGVVEIVIGKRAVVRPIDSGVLQAFFERAIDLNDDTLVELFEVRRGIETQCAILAAERATADELAALRQIVTKMRHKLDDFEEYVELDLEFHLQLAKASHNNMLGHLMESLGTTLHHNIYEGYKLRQAPVLRERVQALHEKLLQELERGDAEAARLAMATHFDEAVLAVREYPFPCSP